MKKYISLEQAIRKAIAEQNYKKAEKPIVEAKEHESLAHTIRNIHEGIAPNDSDKYHGVAAPFQRSPGQGKQQEKIDNQKQNQTLANSRNRANQFPLNNMKRGHIGNVKEGAAPNLKTPEKLPELPDSSKKFFSPSSKTPTPSNSNMEKPPAPSNDSFFKQPTEPTVAEPKTSLSNKAIDVAKYVGSRLLGRLAAPLLGRFAGPVAAAAAAAFFNPEIGMGPNPAGGGRELEQEKQRENDWLKQARLDKEKAFSDIKLKPPIEIPDADVKPKKEPEIKPEPKPDVKPEPKPETKVAPEISKGTRPSEVPDSATAPQAAARQQADRNIPANAPEKKKNFDLNFGGAGDSSSIDGIMPISPHGPVRTSTSQTNALNQISSLSKSAKTSLVKKIVGSRRSFKEEADGTKDRTSIENVARPKSAKSPFDRTSKLAKQSEIKQKIIDENAERLHTIKGVIADKKKKTEIKTPVEFNPKMKKPDVDTDVVGSSA